MDERESRQTAMRKYGETRMQFERGQVDALHRFGRAFSDPMRIRILGLLAGRSMYGQELAEALHVQPPTISHHLNLLKAAGLILVRKENNFHHYDLNTEALQQFADYLTADHLKLVAQSMEPENAGNPPLEKERDLVLNSFFQDGRLLSIPTQGRQRKLVMEKIAAAFEWGRIYDEKEVNTLLKTFHEDTATLRRELINEKLMLRENGRYWLIRPHE